MFAKRKRNGLLLSGKRGLSLLLSLALVLGELPSTALAEELDMESQETVEQITESPSEDESVAMDDEHQQLDGDTESASILEETVEDENATAELEGPVEELECESDELQAEEEVVAGVGVLEEGENNTTEATIAVQAHARPSVTVRDYTGEYDGTSHSVTATVTNGSIYYRTDAPFSYDDAITYMNKIRLENGDGLSTNKPSLTNVGALTIYYLVVPTGCDITDILLVNKVRLGKVDESESPVVIGSAKITVTKKSVANCSISLSQSSYTYDGTAKKPSVTVKNGSMTLTSGTDYTVSYSRNTNAGTATVTVAGTGSRYTGTATKSFTINRKPISSCTATLSMTNYTYDGRSKGPEVTVKDGTKTLSAGAGSDYFPGDSYIVSYGENINVGTGTVTIYGVENYSGTLTKTFTISPKSISGCSLTLSPTSYTYSGSARKPTATVKDGSKALVAGTDYAVTYSNNTNAGTATATVTGKGNYSGTLRGTFAITQKSISSCSTSLSQTSFAYDGKAKEPKVTVKDGTATLSQGKDYEVTYKDNVKVGNATVTVTGKGNYSGATSKAFSIGSVSISSCAISVSPTSSVYDGKAKEPKVTVKAGSKALTLGKDYKVTYSNNTNAGKATATIAGMGKYGGVVNKTFTISAKSVSKCKVKLSSTRYEYDFTAHKPRVTVKDGSKTLKQGTDYRVAYKKNKNAGKAVVTISGQGNYAGSVSKKFTITKVNMADFPNLSSTERTETETGKNIVFKPLYTIGGKALKLGRDYTLSGNKRKAPGTYTIVAKGKGPNFKGIKKDKFVIKPSVRFAIAYFKTKPTLSNPRPTSLTYRKGKADQKVLKYGRDYSVTVLQVNTAAKKMELRFVGKGKYAGDSTLWVPYK